MNKKDIQYWEKRKAQRMFEYMEGAEATAQEIADIYAKASRYLSYKAADIFEKYSDKHELTEKEAIKLLSELKNPGDIEELKRLLENASGEEKKELLAKLEAPAYQFRINRLRQMQNEIDLLMRNVYEQEKIVSTNFYIDLAEEAYYKSIFDIQKKTGLAFSFNTLDAKQIDKALNSKWYGKNYSQRIWNNTDTLAKDLKEQLVISLMTGKSQREVAKELENKFQVANYKARRLVRTESAYFVGQLEAESYKECGIEYYIFIATLDLRTSKICREMDKKRFKVSEQTPWKNYPPLHPFCRSTTIGDIPEEILSEWKIKVRDPVTGKINKIPANMTYNEWYNKYVASDPKARIEEKKIKNLSSDRKQHENYKKVLGKDITDRLDDFQQMKYTENEKWKFTKIDYKRRNELILHPELKLPNAENAILPEGKFTKYLLGGNNEKGLAKGEAFTSRLGYDINNWKKLQEEIKQGTLKYPATYKDSNEFGKRYEQKMVLYGLKENPANVVVGWLEKADGSINMTSAYIKEV